MRRIISTAVYILTFLFITAGCAFTGSPSGTSGTTGTALPGDDEPGIMKFWMRATSRNSVTGKLVGEFNRNNKRNVEIEFEVFGENYKNVVNMALAAGNPPDIFELNGGLTVPQLAQANYIMPLDKYLDEGFKKKFYPEVFQQKQFYYGGKLYAIPERAAFFRLVYNKELFRKAGIPGPPATLEELKADAEVITSLGNGNFYGFGAALKTGSSFTRWCDNICSISGQTGECAFDWKAGKFDFSKQKRALKLLIEMENEKILYPDALNLDIEVARALFGQGKFGIMIDGNWQVAQFGNKEIDCSVDWDSAPIPVFSGEKRGKSFIQYDMGKLIARQAKNPDIAWSFIEFLFDNQDEYVKLGEPLRTMLKANAPANIPADYKGVKGFTDIENSTAFPMQVQNFLTRLEGDKVDKVYQRIFTGEINIDNGLSDLTERYNTALEKAIAGGSLTRGDIEIPGFDYFKYYGLQ